MGSENFWNIRWQVANNVSVRKVFIETNEKKEKDGKFATFHS